MDFLNKIIQSDAKTGLQNIPDNSIDCCVTSPPYWGLRDYGTAIWINGNPECKHFVCGDGESAGEKQKTNTGSLRTAKDKCPHCGAIRIDNQLGLEKTPELYVEKLVEILREVKRVLKPTGTLWLNLGDSYASGKSRYSTKAQTIEGGGEKKEKYGQMHEGGKPDLYYHPFIKDKDLVGIPWRVAFALQVDGWYLRQDIIWSKPNPMPESVTDRCTKSHEYIFLLTKSAKYYYDAEIIKTESIEPDDDRGSRENRKRFPTDKINGIRNSGLYPMANKRSVWTVNTMPYSEAHFATFPEKLIVDCILAGCPEFVCDKCGKPHERILQKGEFIQTGGGRKKQTPSLSESQKKATGFHNKIDCGFQPTCKCNSDIKTGIVLDLFMGSGTTAVVARKKNRNFVGFELNEEYIQIALKRLYEELGMFL